MEGAGELCTYYEQCVTPSIEIMMDTVTWRKVEHLPGGLNIYEQRRERVHSGSAVDQTSESGQFGEAGVIFTPSKSASKYVIVRIFLTGRFAYGN